MNAGLSCPSTPAHQHDALPQRRRKEVRLPCSSNEAGRLWGIFAAHLEQHHVAYSDVIDHEDAYESHCALVEDIVDQIQGRESVSSDMSIDL